MVSLEYKEEVLKMKIIKTLSMEDNPICRRYESELMYVGDEKMCQVLVQKFIKDTRSEYASYMDIVSVLETSPNEWVVLGAYMEDIDNAIITKYTIEG